MKDRINLWITALALHMLARRRKMQDIPDGDPVVSAIWLRQEMEKARNNVKEHRLARIR